MENKNFQLKQQLIMMKLFLFIIIASSSLFLLSCGPSVESYLADFNEFIIEIETAADKMTDEEWLAAEKRYNLLITEDFEKVEQKLSSYDKEKIGKLKGRYAILIYKKNANRLLEGAKDALNEAEGVVEGVIEGLNN